MLRLSRHALRPYAKVPPKPAPDGGFFKKFADSIKEQKDEDLKTSVKRFEETLTEIRGLDSVKRAKEIYGRAKEDALKQNEALVAEVKDKAAAAKEIAGKVSSTVGETLATAAKPIKAVGEIVRPYVPNIGESELAQKIGKTVAETEETLLESTNAYRYGGFKDRGARERTKRRRGAADEPPADAAAEPATAENPEAGDRVVLHRTSRLSQMWDDFKDNSGLLRRFHGLKTRYDESNNIFVFFMRELTGSVADRFRSVFAETETARALREIALRDPAFSLEAFMKDAHEELVPEILDALLSGDLPTLRIWSSEATFNMLKATFDAQLKAGHRMEGRVLDLRHIEVITAKLLDSTPVIVVGFTTQQISYVRDATGAVVDGKEDSIENVHYVMALAKEEAAKGPTKGWRLLEIAIRPGGGW